MDGWKMYFLLGGPIFRGYVSFREDRFPWNKGISLPKHYLLGGQVVWGRYNLTRLQPRSSVSSFKRGFQEAKKVKKFIFVARWENQDGDDDDDDDDDGCGCHDNDGGDGGSDCNDNDGGRSFW